MDYERKQLKKWDKRMCMMGEKWEKMPQRSRGKIFVWKCEKKFFAEEKINADSEVWSELISAAVLQCSEKKGLLKLGKQKEKMMSNELRV